MTVNANQPDREQLLDEIVASYLRALDAGRTPERAEILRRYPELNPELAEFFAEHDRLDRFRATPRRNSTSASPHLHGGMDESDPVFVCPVETPREKIEAGSVLAGHYRIVAVSGGGMGHVYFADDLDAQRNGIRLRVAIKTVPEFNEWREARCRRGAAAEPLQYANLVARFHREAINWVRLGKHDNIILAMTVIEVGAKPYLVMEYADSGSLREWINERRLSVSMTLSFAVQFCAGMQAAVQVAGLVHRDIKPANVLIQNGELLKIADFGLAKAFDLRSGDNDKNSPLRGDAALSYAGGGTIPYMAPEQFECLSRADTRSDIFSFGAMLFEMLTFRRLFDGSTFYESFAQRMRPCPDAHELNARVPSAVSSIIARCVAFDPNNRYQSFDDLKGDLSTIHDSLPDRLPIPKDRNRLAPEFFSASIQILGETCSLVSLGYYKEAARRAQDGIDVDPENAEHWINRSMALGRLQDFSSASECAVRATQLHPTNARAWTNLAWAMLMLQRPATALANAQRATQLDPEFCDGWLCRGLCERELGKPTDAIRSMLLARRLEPHNWKAHANLGFFLADVGRNSEALAALRRAAEINPDDSLIWYKTAWLLASDGQIDEARLAIDRSLKLNEYDAEAWAFRGVILMQGNGDVAAAKASLDRAQQLDPKEMKVRVALRALESLPRDG